VRALEVGRVDVRPLGDGADAFHRAALPGALKILLGA
jgi:hypothetical protein